MNRNSALEFPGLDGKAALWAMFLLGLEGKGLVQNPRAPCAGSGLSGAAEL